MPFILDDTIHTNTGVETIAPSDSRELGPELIERAVQLYRDTEVNSPLVGPFLASNEDPPSLPYFMGHLTTLRPLTTISLYRQDGDIQGVLLTRALESNGGDLTQQAIALHEQQYHESIYDLDEAQEEAEEDMLDTLADEMRTRYKNADKVCAAAFPKGAESDRTIGTALLQSLPADRDYKHIGLKEESSIFADYGFEFLGNEDGYEVGIVSEDGPAVVSLVFMMKPRAG